ncbi:glyoxalase [Paenibacillus darwinianus]|uniref:Glyoxalase n=1 Tax=Paenibacillus darwinianus TaxID=1380763 RepID=A0A9W5S2U6_9BACL|nr:VOC family protein [Paenibacillus darwinianus]EXX90193.1 glyoxalase [Paenibacillus darwinianus]EXX90858.1 glyoxalase [Paenibacillus darwinianus]EXX90911.1 glyoxalase [Paenibacillus darwinianus]
MIYRMHPEMKLGEVKLKVSDLERSVRFYEEIVGLKTLQRTGNEVALTADGRNALVVLEEIPGAVVTKRRSTSGLYHFAILLPTRKDLGLSLRKLIEAGIHIGQSDHYVSEALYISDPDNNGIEIYRDRPREEWTYDEQGHVQMGGDPIDWDGMLREAEGHPWNGMPEGTTIGHVHFHVADLEQSERFYCGQLGLDMMADATVFMGALFVAAGGYHHHFGLNIWAGAGAPAAPNNATGIAYATMILPDRAALDAVLANLRGGGVDTVEEDGAAWITDPSGIRLRLTVG